jgi:hypothetical protein
MGKTELIFMPYRRIICYQINLSFLYIVCRFSVSLFYEGETNEDLESVCSGRHSKASAWV